MEEVGAKGPLYSEVPCLKEGPEPWSGPEDLHSVVQSMMANGHMGNPSEQTDKLKLLPSHNFADMSVSDRQGKSIVEEFIEIEHKNLK